jgi:hypothetical protein
MQKIIKTVEVALSSEYAITKFVNEFNDWWPKEYTWSQDKLVEITIDPKKDGLCTEIGPHGFRCDWGRVTNINKNSISLKWQISPKREPQPDPEKSSDLFIEFEGDATQTIVKLEHFNIDKHGDGSDGFFKAMNAKEGWEYILSCYKTHCEKTAHSQEAPQYSIFN